MYSKIFVPVDNSAHSSVAVDVAVNLAVQLGASLTGSHAYAARLHDMRFRQMEFVLPEQYREETEMDHQREVHDSLITKGLELISDSYLSDMARKAKDAGLKFEPKTYDGKNFRVIADDILENDYDLVVMGALGTGAVGESQIGSVCERVVRRIRTDTLVIKETKTFADQMLTGPDGAGGIIVAVDGSPESYAGLTTALELGRITNKVVESVSVYDPYLHYVLFSSLEKVLSEEAAGAFNFREQEELHENVIDSGLARIYQSHLEVARRIAEDAGVELQITLLAGKAFEKILEYVRVHRPWLLVLGRVGVHSDEDMDIGSNTENLLRMAPCNVLLSSRRVTPDVDMQAEESTVWTEPALKILERAPEFARGIARTVTHQWALERGHSVITTSILEEALATVLPKSALLAMGISSTSKSTGESTGEADASFAPAWSNEATDRLNQIQETHRQKRVRAEIEKQARVSKMETITLEFVEQILGEGHQWTPDAMARLNRIPEGFMRTAVKNRIEEAARVRSRIVIDLEMVEVGISEGRNMMGGAMPGTATDSVDNESGD